MARQVRQGRFRREGFAENRLHKFDLAFLDLRLGPESGLELLPKLLADSPWLKIVVMTAYSSVDTAVEAMKRGAFDYIEKPFALEKLGLVLEKVEKALCIERRPGPPGGRPEKPASRRSVRLQQPENAADAGDGPATWRRAKPPS